MRAEDPLASGPMAWLQAVAAPMVLLDAGGQMRCANNAYTALLGDTPAAGPWPGWTGVARQPSAWPGPACDAWLGGQAVHLQALPWPAPGEGWAVTVVQTPAHDTLQALRLANERVALAARGAGLGIWEVDFSTGQAWWDEAMWRLRGLAPLPHPPGHVQRMSLLHPDDRALLEHEHAAARRERRMSQAEFRVLWPDGQWRWLASRSVVVFDEQGQALRQIGINWDVSVARLAEAAHRQQVQAQAQDQARQRLLARLSHDLRTPLHAVMGLAELLAGLPAGSAVPASHASGILQAARQLQEQLGQLLELADPPAPGHAQPPPAAAPAPPPRGAGRLLYIEDNEVNALIVQELVARRGGPHLAIARNGSSGVAQALAEPPTLVLVDMQLPDMDGFEVLNRLRADPRGARLPCVALSANGMPEDMALARAAGFEDYWTKPLDFKAFLAGLERYFGPA
jgi:CheY-like chemotaxis protein